MSALVHIKDFPREIVVSYAAGTNLLAVSPPAIGKTWQTLAAAATMQKRIPGFGFWSFDLATANPNDVCAYMPDDKTGKLQVFPNGTLPNAYDTPDAKGIVHMDEPLNADPATAKVFQKYINNEDISGKLRKPEGVICVLTSNRLMDKAGVMQQSRAFLSRLEQIEVFSDPGHNVKFADNSGWYPTLVKFLEKFPHLIDTYEQVFCPPKDAQQDKRFSKDERDVFSEESKSGVWANMRSWERISKLEYASLREGLELKPYRIISNVGKVAGQQYITYRAIQDKIASVDQIIADPKGVTMPENIAELYIMLSMLAQLVPQNHVKQAGIFIDRLPGDLRAVAIRRLVKRSQRDRAAFDIGATKEYQKWMQDPSISDLFAAAK